MIQETLRKDLLFFLLFSINDYKWKIYFVGEALVWEERSLKVALNPSFFTLTLIILVKVVFLKKGKCNEFKLEYWGKKVEISKSVMNLILGTEKD